MRIFAIIFLIFCTTAKADYPERVVRIINTFPAGGSGDAVLRVIGVHPPSTRTDRILQVMKDAAKAKFGDENRYEELIRAGVFGRMIEPGQVGDTVAFLASPRAGLLSGVVLNMGT